MSIHAIAKTLEREPVLWDVVEEHLDEAQFACEQLEVQLDHATLNLARVECGIEERLLAHADGLVVGGEVVSRELLQPVFTDAEAETGRIVAASLASTLGELPRIAAEALLHPELRVRTAVLRGVQLAAAAPPWLQAWASDRFREREHEAMRDTLMPLIAAKLSVEQKAMCLASGAPSLIGATLRALTSEDTALRKRVEELLHHAAYDVVRPALITALSWGSARGYQTLREHALSGDTQAAPRMALYSALCKPTEHARLVELLSRAELRGHVLFALGFSGNVGVVPSLIEHLSSNNKIEAKIAAQSIATITGLDTQDDAYCLAVPAPRAVNDLLAVEQDPEAKAALPALEEDDLAADLVPLPEDALPDPDPAAVLRQWQVIASNFNPSERYVLGAPLSRTSLLNALTSARMRTRHVLAQALCVRTNGHCAIDTRALARRQRSRIEALQGGSSSPFLHNPRFT